MSELVDVAYNDIKASLGKRLGWRELVLQAFKALPGCFQGGGGELPIAKGPFGSPIALKHGFGGVADQDEIRA